jgi:chemotaxis protein CheD
MEIVIGIGEYAVSETTTDAIKTYALASCVAVTAYCPSKKAAGMIHIALPAAPAGAEQDYKPAYYADMGVPLLIQAMSCHFGCRKEEMILRMYGGADSIRKNDRFNIGRRNIEAVTSVLSGMDLRVHSADVGGTISRTITLDVATGAVKTVTQDIVI